MAHQASALVKVRFLKARRRPAGTSYHQSVILRRNNLMRLPEFTRSTTLPWSSPARPYLLLLWPESVASRYCGQPLIFLFLADVAAALVRLAAASRPLRASRHHVAGRRRKVMHEMDTVARREDPAKPTSGLDAKRVADMSRVSAKALDDLWQRAMKNSPRAEGLRDNNATNQRIVKEIRARRNPISFDGTEFESSLGDL
jgi:hypothetical protein